MGTGVCNFGKHKGTPWTRVPVSYLKWMINVGHTQAVIAEEELRRRGTVTPDLEVSGHAIDRASQRCLDKWKETRRDKKEGLHAWLVRVAGEARMHGKLHRGKYQYLGMQFAFEEDGVWPVLLTVMK